MDRLTTTLDTHLTVILVFGLMTIAAAVGLNIVDSYAGVTVTVGSSEVSRRNIDQIHHALGATAGVTVGRYDSLDSPAGVNFVAASPGFTVTQLQANADSATDTVVFIGYGSSHVEDSAAAPLASNVVAEITLPAGSGFNQVDLAIPIPAGRHPWIRVTGPASVPGRVAVEGITN